jgi:hypothetical protein
MAAVTMLVGVGRDSSVLLIERRIESQADIAVARSKIRREADPYCLPVRRSPLPQRYRV